MSFLCRGALASLALVAALLLSARALADPVMAPTSGVGGSTSRFVNSTATTVAVTVSRTTLIADGIETATATATVRDANGDLVTTDCPSISGDPASALTLVSASCGSFEFTAPTDAGTPASVTITATDDDVSPAISGSTTLLLQPAPSFTWAGDVGQLPWSVGGTWSGGAAPSGTVGTLTFPDLSGCSPGEPAIRAPTTSPG